MGKQQSAKAKTKTQISFAVTTKLLNTFVFATWKIQFLFFLNPKFQAFSCLLCFYSPVCVRPVRKPHCWFSHEVAHLCLFPVSMLSVMSTWNHNLLPRYFSSKMNRLVGKPTMWFLNRSDTNRAVEAEKTARSLKFWI